MGYIIVHFSKLAALAALMISGCTIPTSIDTTKTINPAEFRMISGTSRSANSDLSIAVATYELNGNVMICAAAAAGGNLDFRTKWPPALLRKTTVRMNGELLVSGLDFGAHYFDDALLNGKQAKCATIDKPWKSNYSYRNMSIRLGPVQIID